MRRATWDSECRTSLVFPNPDGDVAICGLWTKTEDIAAGRVFGGPECAARVAISGPLRTPIGIGWMLRGLWLHPNIRHVVVTGQDLSHTGAAIVDLWREGLTPDGRVPGMGWAMRPPIDAESIDRLRDDVTVWDWRGVDDAEVCRRVAGLEQRGGATRDVREFPPVEISERLQLPSRGTLFPIAAESVGEGWLHVLNAVMSCGETKGTRKGDRLKEIVNTAVVIDPRYLPDDPVEAPFFDFSREGFESYWGDFIARQKPSGQDYSYGERMQSWPMPPPGATLAQLPATALLRELLARGRDRVLRRTRNGGAPALVTVDQLAAVRERLRRSPDTKRGTIVFLGPTDMEELDDAPCLSMATFNRWGGRLFGTFVIRSNDMYGAWPHNALSLRRLQKDMAHELGVEPGATTIISHSAHIYERHWEQAYAKVDEWLDSGKIMKWYRELGWDGPAGGLRPDPAGNFEFAQSPEGVRIRLMSQEADEVLREASGANPRPLLRAMLYRMPWIRAAARRVPRRAGRGGARRARQGRRLPPALIASAPGS